MNPDPRVRNAGAACDPLRLACLVVLLASPLLASSGAPAYSAIGLGGLTPGFESRAFAINTWARSGGPPAPPTFHDVGQVVV